MQSQSFRNLTVAEGKLVQRLFEVDFPGREALWEQIQSSRVRRIDENGSLEFDVDTNLLAHVKKRIPVEGQATDSDGIPIYVLLHVVSGKIRELEIYKADSSPIAAMPAPRDIELLVLD
jgi:hypothetical protein